ncbi:MAG TPA: hypothetical protein VNW94_13735 [Streptosporangiaceae bacterium]|nr:hypothetical protein [Streptosporangiaceae bacterium]
MRFSKSLAAAGVLSIGLLTGTALAGAAYADTTHAGSRPTTSPVHSVGNQGKSSKNDNHRRTTSTVSATVTPGYVRQGQSYTVNIATTGISDGTRATVANIDGRTYRVTVESGTATQTLDVPKNTRPGSHRVTVTVGGLSATAHVNVGR